MFPILPTRNVRFYWTFKFSQVETHVPNFMTSLCFSPYFTFITLRYEHLCENIMRDMNTSSGISKRYGSASWNSLILYHYVSWQITMDEAEGSIRRKGKELWWWWWWGVLVAVVVVVVGGAGSSGGGGVYLGVCACMCVWVPVPAWHWHY